MKKVEINKTKKLAIIGLIIISIILLLITYIGDHNGENISFLNYATNIFLLLMFSFNYITIKKSFVLLSEDKIDYKFHNKRKEITIEDKVYNLEHDWKGIYVFHGSKMSTISTNYFWKADRKSLYKELKDYYLLKNGDLNKSEATKIKLSH